MWIRLNDIELSENVWCNAIVDFECSRRGSPGNFWEPGEGPEFEIIELYVEEAWGVHWNKGRTEMGSWVSILDKRLAEVIDPDHLYEAQYDEFCSYGD